MSIYYFIALLSTSLGIFLLLVLGYSLTTILLKSNRPYMRYGQAILLLIAVLLTVWGIDMLVHLDQF